MVKVSNDVLATASQALDIAWTVKDGLLFHQIASIITAAVPTIFVYDGTSSPYKALQELASYQGVGPGQVLLIDRARGSEDYNACLDEAMEDGMWVVVSNCDNDLNFWTQISFKLYQLKLEATVHPNYRLFIIIKQAAAEIVPGYHTDNLRKGKYEEIFLPRYVLQHSYVVCLEPPSTEGENFIHCNALCHCH